MAEIIAQSITKRVPLKAYLADGVTDATGKTIAVTISKNGGAFGNPSAGATNATEIASGWYYVDLSTTDTGTLGPLIVRGTATGVDNSEVVYTVAVASVAQTGDNFARLGAPAGASVSADIAAAKVDTAAVKLQTDKLAFTVANQVDSNVIDWKGAAAPAMTGDAFARLGAPAGASVSADIATRSTYGGGDTAGTTTLLARVPGTVQPQTGDVFARLGAPAGASVSADVAAVAAYVDTEVAAILAAVDTEVAAIITTLGAAGAGLTALGDARLANLDATVSSRLASGSYTAPDNATITAIAGFVDTEVAAIKLKTDLIPAAPAAVGDVPTAIQNADALLDRAAGVETGLTPRQALRLFAAALLGKVSGAAANAPKFRDTGDTKDRITATTDADGNRTSVTLDPS